MNTDPNRRRPGIPTAISADLVQPPRFALTAFTVLLACSAAITLGWAATHVVDEITIGEGRIVPASKLKVVQSLEGGIIREISVREGALVKAGDVLLILDPTGFDASLAEQREKLAGLEATRARLIAEVNGTLPQFPAGPVSARPELIANEKRIHESRIAELAAALDAFDQSARQREQEITETEARILNLAEAAAITERELAIIRPMVQKGVAAKVELVRLEQRLNETKGQLEAAELSLPRIKAALAEAQHHRREKEQNFKGEAMTRLSATEVEYAALLEAAKANADKVKRTRVVSPVNGTIKTVAASTIGEVVRPGISIVEIVPTEDSLLVEARVKPQDIAFLHPGLPATIELTAYDPTRYGGLKGTLEHISADSTTTEKGETFYTIRLRTSDTSLFKNDKEMPVIPGMVATAKIKVGQKTVLDFLAKPVMRLANGSLQER